MAPLTGVEMFLLEQTVVVGVVTRVGAHIDNLGHAVLRAVGILAVGMDVSVGTNQLTLVFVSSICDHGVLLRHLHRDSVVLAVGERHAGLLVGIGACPHGGRQRSVMLVTALKLRYIQKNSVPMICKSPKSFTAITEIYKK